MKLGFYGAADEVTGSNFVLETDQHKIAIDCGMFQGARFSEAANEEPLSYDPRSLDALVLTHAHLDHCGRIPLLWKLGFRGKIYATPATRDLAELIMSDAAEIMLHDQQDDPTDEPLYLAVDVAGAMTLFSSVEYREPTEILPGVTLEFYDAGHILGSASALLTVGGKKILFSGDIGNHPVPILRSPEVPDSADIVIMETTYGDRLHEAVTDRRQLLRAAIRQAVGRRGALLIPAFALERTQELLYEIRLLVQEQAIPSLPIFLDSPLAIAATDVYYDYKRYYDTDAMHQLKSGRDLFKFPLLRITETPGQSKTIKQIEGPKVIIAGSGMMEGGRMIHHAREYLDDQTTTLLFVGYQAQGTLGRQLFDGRKRVKIKGKWVDVKARIDSISGYSAHADQTALTEWLEQLKQPPQSLYLVHGEHESAQTFAQKIGSQYQAVIPKKDEVVTLS